MERKDYIIIILVIALVGVVSFSSAYMLASQPKTNNSSNSLNNSSNNTTINQTSQVQNKSETHYITGKQAINIIKKRVYTETVNQYTFRAVFVSTDGDPYYAVIATMKETNQDQPIMKVDAETGEILSSLC